MCIKSSTLASFITIIFCFLTTSVSGQQRSTLQDAEPVQRSPKAQKPSYQTRRTTPAYIENTRILNSKEFDTLVARGFVGANYHANSCGGSHNKRKTIIAIPGSYSNSEFLPRLDWNIPVHIRNKTMREKIQFSENPPIVRDAKVRACINQLDTYQWRGLIENGKLVVRMQFKVNPIVKTRIISEQKNGSWEERWEWNENIADSSIPDYIYVAPHMNVYLNPVIQNNRLTYNTIDVKWAWAEDKGFPWPQYAVGKAFYTPEIKQKVLEFKENAMNIMRQRLNTAFNHPNVRNKVSSMLTDHVISGGYAGRELRSITAKEESIQINFVPK